MAIDDGMWRRFAWHSTTARCNSEPVKRASVHGDMLRKSLSKERCNILDLFAKMECNEASGPYAAQAVPSQSKALGGSSVDGLGL